MWNFIFYWFLPFLGAGSVVGVILRFVTKPKLEVEFETSPDRPGELVGLIFNKPITNRFACRLHIQRKVAEHVLVHFVVRKLGTTAIPNSESTWIQANVYTGHGFPSVRVPIPPSEAQSSFTIANIHPDSGAVHLEEDGPLLPGKYVVTVRVEEGGIYKHAARQLNVTAWPPHAFWVGPTTPLQSLQEL